MLYHKIPLQLYNIGKLQSAAGDMKQHLMCVMHLVDVTLYRHFTRTAKGEFLKCYIAMVTRNLGALSLNRALRLKILQMSEEDSC